MQQPIIRFDQPSSSNNILNLGDRQVTLSGVARPVNHVKAGHTIAKTQTQSDDALYGVHQIPQGAVDAVLAAGGIAVLSMFALLASTMRQHDLNHTGSSEAATMHVPESFFRKLSGFAYSIRHQKR